MAAHLDWNEWSLDYEVKDKAGLAIRNVRFKNVRFLYKASVPVIRVKYEGDDCGPYNDKIKWGNLAEFTDCDNNKICMSTVSYDGVDWLDMRVGAHIGAYRIQQAWQLSRDGRIAARVWSRGVSCPTDHVHHPYWRFDFDIDPSPALEVYSRNGDAPGTWMKYEVETAVQKNPARRLDLFAPDVDGRLWHRKYDGWNWHPWQDLDGVFKGTPAAVSKSDERIDVFVWGVDDKMGHKTWIGGEFARWSGWKGRGGPIASSPTVASWAANRLDCFARGPGADLLHKAWDGEEWGDWHSHGATFKGAPAAISRRHETIDVFVRGMDDHMGHLWYSDGDWHGWEDLGGPIGSSPTVASWAADRLDCFARGPTNDLLHKAFDGSKWGDWHSHGGTFQESPTAVSWGLDRIDVFVRGMDNHTGHLWYDKGDWHGWEDLGAPSAAATPALGGAPGASKRDFIRTWVLRQPHSNHFALLFPGHDDGRTDEFVKADFAIRQYHQDEDSEWPFGCWEGLGWDENEPVFGHDDVLWYVAHLTHHAHGEEEGSLGEWLHGGPVIELHPNA